MRRPVLPILALALIGSPAVAGGAVLLERVEPEALPEAVERSDFAFSLGPGQTYQNQSEVLGLIPADFDVYVVTITAMVDIEMDLADCCGTGDTICFALDRPNPVPICATSPDTLTRSFPGVPPGTYRVGIGFSEPHTGVFPAGYILEVRASGGGVCDINTCGGFTGGCGGDPTCFCYGSTEGEGFCGTDQSCDAAQGCTTSADCPTGFFCVPDSCCATPVCLASDCAGESARP